MSDLIMNMRGQDWPVRVTSGGRFVVDLPNGETVESDTYDRLREKMLDATKKLAADVKIEFVEAGWDAKAGRVIFRHGVAIGENERTNALSVVWDGSGRRQQVQAYQLRTTMRPLSDEEAADYDRLVRASRAADAELETWAEARKIKVREELRAQVAKALTDES
jgi:hypothetical protein